MVQYNLVTEKTSNKQFVIFAIVTLVVMIILAGVVVKCGVCEKQVNNNWDLPEQKTGEVK